MAETAPGLLECGRLLALVGGQFGVQVGYSGEFAAANPIESRLQLPHWSWPLIQAADPISGFILQPIVGELSDRSRSRFGRRTPWMAGGSALMLICIILLVLVETMTASPSGRRAAFVIAFVLYNIGLNTMQGPARSLIQDIVVESQMVWAQSLASILVAAGVIVANLPGGVTGLMGIEFEPTTSVLIATGALVMVTVIGAICAAREQQQEPEANEGQTNAFAETCRAVRQMPRALWLVCLVVLFGVLAFTPYQVCVADFFGRDVFGGDPAGDALAYRRGIGFGMMSTCAGAVVAVVYCLCQDALVRRFGISRVLAAGFALSAVALAPAPLTTNRWVLFVLFLLPTVNFLQIQSLSYAVMQRVVDPRDAGVYVGILDIFIEIGCELAVLVFQLGIGSIWTSRAPTIFCGAPMALCGLIVSLLLAVPAEGGAAPADTRAPSAAPMLEGALL